jgi:hypothetical protein
LRLQAFCPGHYPQVDQHSSVLQQVCYSPLKQEDKKTLQIPLPFKRPRCPHSAGSR